MSDQVSGPFGTMLIMFGILFWLMEPYLQWTGGNSITLSDFLIPLPVVVPMILIGLYMVTHPRPWGYRAEERVERIRIKYDEKEE
jgi:hypothetical protein